MVRVLHGYVLLSRLAERRYSLDATPGSGAGALSKASVCLAWRLSRLACTCSSWLVVMEAATHRNMYARLTAVFSPASADGGARRRP